MRRDLLPPKGQGYLRKLAKGQDRLDVRLLLKIAGTIEDLLIKIYKLENKKDKHG